MSSTPVFHSSAVPFLKTPSPKPDISANLDPVQEAHFFSKLDQNHLFVSKDKSLQLPFNTKALFLILDQLLTTNGVEVDHMFLYGSQMTDVLLNADRSHRDIDFLITIKSGGNPYLVRDIFLKSLVQLFGIESNPMNEKALMVLFHHALESSGVFSNIIPITISTSGIQIDITIAWDLEISCGSSANCFRGDMLPYLRGKGRLNQFSGSSGYEPLIALDLFKRGFFFVQSGHPAKVRDGLRLYMNVIISGTSPIHYQIEQEYLTQWQKDYPSIEKRGLFLKTIVNHISKHFDNDQFSIAIFLLNIRSFFISKEFNEKEAWMLEYDQFCNSYLSDVKALGAVLFWNYSGNPAEGRLDCSKTSAPTRFRVRLNEKLLLIEGPWEETLNILIDPLSVNLGRFQSEFKPAAMVSRLKMYPLIEHPLARLLVYATRGDSDNFVEEYALQQGYFATKQQDKLERLFELFFHKNTFKFGRTTLEFLRNARRSGHEKAARAAFERLNIQNPTPIELEAIFAIADDLPSLMSLAQKAPKLVQTHLEKQRPSILIFRWIEATQIQGGNYGAEWLDFIRATPQIAANFLNCPSFSLELRIQLATKLVDEPERLDDALAFFNTHNLFESIDIVTKLPPSEAILQRVKSLPLGTWSSKWIEFIEKHPEHLQQFLACHTFGSDLHSQVAEKLIDTPDALLAAWDWIEERSPELLPSLAFNHSPSSPLFLKIKHLKTSPWPDAWIDFVEQNPGYLIDFLNSQTFALEHKVKLSRKLAHKPAQLDVCWNFLEINVPETLLETASGLPITLPVFHKIRKLPQAPWPIAWGNLVDASILKDFLEASTFSDALKSQVVSRLLQNEHQFEFVWEVACTYGAIPIESKAIQMKIKKCTAAELVMLSHGLMTLYETNRGTAVFWTASFLKQIPLSALENNTKGIQACWRLLQLATLRPLRAPPLNSLEVLNLLKMLLKGHNDLLPAMTRMIVDDSLTSYHRTDLISDLFSFTRFLHPHFEMSNGAAFSQNFFNMIIALFEQNSMFATRRTVIHSVATFSGKQISLPALMASAERPFEQCLMPLAADLQGSDDTLAHYIHWLIEHKDSRPEANAVLTEVAKTATEKQVTSSDAVVLMGSLASVSRDIVKQAMKGGLKPLTALSFLNHQKGPYRDIDLFEEMTTSHIDWSTAIRLALEVKRLGGKALLPHLLKNKGSYQSENLPTLTLIADSPDGVKLLWESILPSFAPKNIPFQIQLAKLCRGKSEEVDGEIKKQFMTMMNKQITVDQIIEILKLDLVPLSAWAVSERIGEPKVLKVLMIKLQATEDLDAAFRVLAQICRVTEPQDSASRVSSLFKDYLSKLEGKPFGFIWNHVRPLFDVENLSEYIPSEFMNVFFEMVLKIYREDQTDTELVSHISTMRAFFTEKFWTRESRKFLEEIIEARNFVRNPFISLDEVWDTIEEFPEKMEWIDQFLDRLSASLNYPNNIRLLSEVVSTENCVYDREKILEIFRSHLQAMSQYHAGKFWGALAPIVSLNNISQLIPSSEWRPAFDLTLAYFRRLNNKESEIPSLSNVLVLLRNSAVWSEDCLLFIARSLNCLVEKYSSFAVGIFEFVLNQAQKTFKDPEKQKEAGVHIAEVFKKLNNDPLYTLRFIPDMQVKYDWVTTPLKTSREILVEFYNLLDGQGVDFEKKWLDTMLLINTIHWKMEEFDVMLDILQKLSERNLDLTLAMQFAVVFHLGNYIGNASVKTNLGLIQQFCVNYHKFAINFYRTAHATFAESDKKQLTYAPRNATRQFIMDSGGSHALAQSVEYIPDAAPRAFMLLKNASIHAVLMNLCTINSTSDPITQVSIELTKELQTTLFSLDFFNLYERLSFNLVLNELYKVYLRGDTSDRDQLYIAVDRYVKESSMLKTMNPMSRGYLRAIFIGDQINAAASKGSPKIFGEIFDYHVASLLEPKWGLESDQQFHTHALTFMAIFIKYKEVERGLRCAELVTEILSQYAFNAESIKAELKIKAKNPNADPKELQNLGKLAIKAIEKQHIEKAIERAMKVPHLAKKATNLLELVNMTKKQTKAFRRLI